MKTNRKVMLVDDCQIDNYVNRKMITHYRFSEKVDEYQDSTEALAYLKALDCDPGSAMMIPDFIFLDMNMPIMNGHQFISEYSKLSDRIKKKCRIIILSSVADIGELALSVRNPDVIAVLRKPLIKMNLDQIETIIEDLRRPRFWNLRQA